MLPASNRGAGMNMGFPDVCLTPAGPAVAPVPYPNLAMHAQAVPFSPTVYLSMMNGLNMISAIPMTMGDEAGVAHPFFKQRGAFTMGNPIVNIDMMPAINLTSMTSGNMMNNPVGAVLVPAVTNVFFSWAIDPAGVAERLERGGRSLGDELDAGVGRLVIEVFSAELPSRAHLVIEGLVSRGARVLVVDLRGCPGGAFDAFLELAGEFLDAGLELATVIDVEGDACVHRSRRAAAWTLPRLPLVILIDGGTASSAELFAGALRAHGRAVLVGARTHGKNAVNEIVPGHDASVYAQAGTALLPGGVSFANGIEPDVVVAADVAEARAREIAAAIAVR